MVWNYFQVSKLFIRSWNSMFPVQYVHTYSRYTIIRKILKISFHFQKSLIWLHLYLAITINLKINEHVEKWFKSVPKSLVLTYGKYQMKKKLSPKKMISKIAYLLTELLTSSQLILKVCIVITTMLSFCQLSKVD